MASPIAKSRNEGTGPVKRALREFLALVVPLLLTLAIRQVLPAARA
jgi:hypothetical protein